MDDVGYYFMESFSRISLFVLSVSAITVASRRVVQQDKESSPEKSEIVQTLTWYHVIAFPLIGSVMLLVLFYFFDYIQFVFSLISICMSVFTLFCFIYPTFDMCYGSQRHHTIITAKPTLSNWNTLLSLTLSLSMTILWVLTAHWLLLDILGVAIACFMIQFVRLPSLKLAAVFLILLLVYDVFWVFFSSSIFNANVMVEVAIKKAKSPIAVVADTLNMPQVSQAQPFLSLPGKLIVPSSMTEDHYSMLGLGDIVLPGLLLCLAMRFDHMIPSNGSNTSRPLQCRRYYDVCIVGYVIGLILASLMVELVNYPQPALLYLVPCVLIPLTTKATTQGHLKLLWHGPFNETPSSSRLTV